MPERPEAVILLPVHLNAAYGIEESISSGQGTSSQGYLLVEDFFSGCYF